MFSSRFAKRTQDSSGLKDTQLAKIIAAPGHSTLRRVVTILVMIN
jgi:hypothetical protein